MSQDKQSVAELVIHLSDLYAAPQPEEKSNPNRGIPLVPFDDLSHKKTIDLVTFRSGLSKYNSNFPLEVQRADTYSVTYNEDKDEVIRKETEPHYSTLSDVELPLAQTEPEKFFDTCVMKVCWGINDSIQSKCNASLSSEGHANFREHMQRLVHLEWIKNIVCTPEIIISRQPILQCLYMGMAPHSPEAPTTSYVDKKYVAGTLFDGLANHAAKWNAEELKLFLSETDMLFLRTIFKKEKIPLIKTEFSIDDIVANKDCLLQLGKKPYDWISEEFIPRVLSALAKDPTDKYPRSLNYYADGPMCMTTEGRERWKFVIDNYLEFSPFYNLEHLEPLCTPEQRVLLKEILAKRAELTKDSEPTLSMSM